MAEWHVTPDYIINNWTEELLNLMLEKRAERLTRLVEPTGEPISQESGKVSEDLFYAMAGNLIEFKEA